jgi:3-methylfumaryl-CoA hydratase
MAESLEKFKSYIGKSETAFDVVTGATMLKFAATLGLEKAPLDKGEIVPPGWHGGFFPPSHRPSQMREDGQSSGGGFMPAIPLPRRRIGGTRMTFHEPLRVGDEIKKVTEIADLQVDDGPNGAMVTIVERSSISSSRGLGVVEERDMIMLSEARADAAPKAAPTVTAEAKWEKVFEPKATLLFRF